jgi:hypothetical protein
MRGLLSAHDTREASDVARAFAQRALTTSGVTEVWYLASDVDPVLSVITSDFDLERDLQLQAALVALRREMRPATSLTLEIFAEPEGVPSSVKTGQRL